jgi:hypothetical protein
MFGVLANHRRYDTAVIDKIPDECKKIGQEDFIRPPKLSEFSHNVLRASQEFINTTNRALDITDEGVDAYLSAQPDKRFQTSRKELAMQILRKALALRFVEVLLQRRVMALESQDVSVPTDARPTTAPKDWHLKFNLFDRYKVYVDFLLNGENGNASEKAGFEDDPAWPRISRFLVPRIEFESSPQTVAFPISERRQYLSSVTYGYPAASPSIANFRFTLTKVADYEAERKKLFAEHSREGLGLLLAKKLLDNPSVYGRSVNPVALAVGELYEETRAVWISALRDPHWVVEHKRSKR